MSPYQTIPDALPEAVFNELKAEALAHPMVSESTLSRGFQSTRGYAVAFTDEGIENALRRFPFFQHFFKAIGIGDPSADLGDDHGVEKAYYLNLLMVPVGADVSRHVDATLQGPIGIPGLTPARVSVLWLGLPKKMKGGLLTLYRGRRRVGRIRPLENLLVHFDGNLAHEVGKVYGRDSVCRSSLVCEQYLVPRGALNDFPSFSIHSKIDFASHLAFATRHLEDR